MCDKCDLDMAMYGEVRTGFRCSDATEDLLAEEANGIPRFLNRKKAALSPKTVEVSEKTSLDNDTKPDAER